MTKKMTEEEKIQKTTEMLDQIDFSKMKHCRLLAYDYGEHHERMLAWLEIRDKQTPLFDTDFYSLLAMGYTDKMEGIDIAYVDELRDAIYEDMENDIGLLDIIKQGSMHVDAYTKEVFDLFLAAYKEYKERVDFFLDNEIALKRWERRYGELLKKRINIIEGLDEKFKKIYYDFSLYSKQIGTLDDLKVIKEQYKNDDNIDLINIIIKQMEEYIMQFHRFQHILESAAEGEVRLKKELFPSDAFETMLEFAPTHIKILNRFEMRVF